MTTLTAEQRWVHWWCNPWPWAHPAWQSRFAVPRGLSLQACEALMRSRHGVFLESIGIAPSQPPPAGEALLRWFALTSLQREQALALAQRICFNQAHDDSADGQWCLALSKALRPGIWLPPACQDARLLLGAWLGPACWSRLRLAWPPGEVAVSPCEAPQSKLQTLWQAILWRVTAI